MKVNILTQPLYTNYGGILQNYALQEVLRRMGHEPLTLNVPPSPPAKAIWWKDMAHTIINAYKKTSGFYPYPFLSPKKNAKKIHEFSKDFGAFIDNHISKVDVRAPFTPKTAQDFPADAWIVGSDQVWRPCYSNYIKNCFFDFLSDYHRRIAYAASFGTDKWEINEEMTSVIVKLAHKFHGISVREQSAVSLAKKHLNLDVTQVLDPTLLLDSQDYINIIPTDLLASDKNQLTTYILDPDKLKIKKIKEIASEQGLTVKTAGKIHSDRMESIEDWLADFANATAIVTDSFHGTVFSIIFNKPFIVLKNDIRGNARLDSLLDIIKPQVIFNKFLKPSLLGIETLQSYRSSSLNWLNLHLN